LISAHHFPLVGHLALNVVFKYLIDAPQIVKTLAPMSWTYVNAPNDGTIWLEWLPSYKQNRLPSDGYVWGDPESVFRQEYGGYTIEGMVHQLGYRPGLDSVASHARTRYHFISKAPNVNAAPPDPSLWIIHYHQAENRNILPIAQLPFDPQTRQLMLERQHLQSQGRLEKRDFMLHDREHWPHINGPSGREMGHTMMAPGFYGANPMPSQGRYNQAAPPAKRQRTQGSVGVAGIPEGMPDTSIEDEENTALGDYFDHLTPRDISTARYMQHHRWMEEVFSSPYASGQIVPADLGLGLMGEMKSLTDGLLEPPSMDFESGEKQITAPEEAKPFTNVKKEQVDEFNKRVQKHLDDGHAEIERMKAEHAAKMQEWRKTKTLLQAEKRLRSATWEGYEPAAYRLEELEVNDQTGDKRETVEQVLQEVEGILGVKFAGYADATLIEKGGWEEGEAPPTRQSSSPEEQAGAQAGEAPQSKAEQLEPMMPANVPQPNAPQAPHQQQQQSSAPQTQHSMQPQAQAQSSYPQQQQQQQQQPQQNMSSTNNSDLQLPEGMDLDTTDLQFPSAGVTPAQTGTPGQNQTPGDSTAFSMPQSNVAPSDAAASSAQQQPGQPLAQQGSAAMAHLGAQPGSNAASTGPQGTPAGDMQDTSMFNDTFGDLAGEFGQSAGDGMLDFGDDSAFGEALHGMDTPGDGDMFGAGGQEGTGP
jgi:hypothetical protein